MIVSLWNAPISRAEASHHLKTLAESYIYFHWVGIQTDDSRGKLLIANELHCKIKLYDASPEFDPEKEARNRFQLMIQAWTNGLQREWESFRDNLYAVAQETGNNMVGWYNRVYKQACETAHMSDLSEFMPSDSRPLA